ncbi:hypothetical protein [Enterobacter hormaechei]
MSTSTIEAGGSAWATIAEEPELPPHYQGTATPQAPPATEAIPEQIRALSYKKITPHETGVIFW